MAPQSSTLSWKIPGRLQSMGSLRVTQLRAFTFTFHFHELEKEMATHSSVLAWRIPETGEPGGLLSMRSHRIGHDESALDCKEIQPVHSEGHQPWDFFGRNDAKAETPVLWPPHAKS